MIPQEEGGVFSSSVFREAFDNWCLNRVLFDQQISPPAPEEETRHSHRGSSRAESTKWQGRWGMHNWFNWFWLTGFLQRRRETEIGEDWSGPRRQPDCGAGRSPSSGCTPTSSTRVSGEERECGHARGAWGCKEVKTMIRYRENATISGEGAEGLKVDSENTDDEEGRSQETFPGKSDYSFL